MKIPNFLKRKRNILILAIILVLILVGFLLFNGKNGGGLIQTGFAEKQDLQATVLSTGQVVSGTDLSLSFQGSGVVRKINVVEGSKVYKGQLLASLDQSSALASLTTAKGSLAQAQANYDKLVAGATFDGNNSGSISIKSRQIALDGAYDDALLSLNDARLKSYNALAAATLLQNTYFKGFDQGARDGKAEMQSAFSLLELSLDKAKTSKLPSEIDSALSVAVNSLNKISAALKIIRDTVDTTYYYGIVPDSEKTAIDTQRTNINTSLTGIITNQQAIANAKISLLQSQPEIALAKAQILSAQGQVDAAQATMNNTVIVAPSGGTITRVEIKVGEQAVALKEAIVLQDVDNLYAEADVSEANIAEIEVGQEIDYTFDALGPNQNFFGKVLTVNPGSTVVSGVVNYRVSGSLENVPKIKPGMTVNMTILIKEKNDVLAVPSMAIVNKNDKNFVRVIDDSKKKTYREVEVQTGLRADGGLIEIISGLNEGQEIVTYMK